jgi:hypothetical protein
MVQARRQMPGHAAAVRVRRPSCARGGRHTPGGGGRGGVVVGGPEPGPVGLPVRHRERSKCIAAEAAADGLCHSFRVFPSFGFSFIVSLTYYDPCSLSRLSPGPGPSRPCCIVPPRFPPSLDPLFTYGEGSHTVEAIRLIQSRPSKSNGRGLAEANVLNSGWSLGGC